MLRRVKGKLVLPLALMAVFALSRIPGLMPENFSAAYALAFCAGVYFPGRLAWWLPLGTLFITDIVINVFCYHTTPLGFYMIPGYLLYAGLIWFGRRLTPKASFFTLVGGGLLGAVVFYLVSNTWAWLQSAVYAKTILGWLQALTTGEPGYPPTWTFFRNTLMSGGLFAGLFVGAMKLSEAAESARKKEAEETAPEPEEEEAPEEAKA